MMGIVTSVVWMIIMVKLVVPCVVLIVNKTMPQPERVMKRQESACLLALMVISVRNVTNNVVQVVL